MKKNIFTGAVILAVCAALSVCSVFVYKYKNKQLREDISAAIKHDSRSINTNAEKDYPSYTVTGDDTSIIDQGIQYHDTNYIIKCGFVLIALAVFGYLFALVCQWYASKTSQSVGTALRKDMYHQINQFDDKNLDKLTAPS